MGKTTIAEVVKDTCTAIWDVLKDKYLPRPSKEMWCKISDNYFQKWNFPNCIGAIDGKHVRVKCPGHTGSKFYNYKHFFSILLQAVADADCKLIAVDIGAVGRQSDGGNFRTSSLYNLLETGKLDVPPDTELPGSVCKIPFVLVGDEGYPLLPYLMRPYPARNLDNRQRIFNYRLSRARRSVECAFGIMSSKWRILHKCIETNEENAVKIIKAICILHNFVLDNERLDSNYLTQDVRTEHARRTQYRFTTHAQTTRDTLLNYFNGIGAVPWQNDFALPENILQRNNNN